MKFVIVSIRQISGGAIALHQLCSALNGMGYKASIYYIGEYDYRKGRKLQFWIKQLFFSVIDLIKAGIVKIIGEKKLSQRKRFNGYVGTTVKGCPQKILPFVGENTIVIYPDIVYGNFLHAKKIVRWLLYYNRYDDNAYEKNDLFFAYREVFNDSRLNPDNNLLHLVNYDLNLYKRTNFGKREGKCYIVRKGAERSDLPNNLDGIIIDPLTEEQKVQVFNKCEYCISYDTQTAYSRIAAICGCVSIVVPEKGKNWMDYCDSVEEKYGVAYGFNEEEIEWAKKTADRTLQSLVQLNSECEKNTEDFIKICETYFLK